jgi:hypothetical protein
MTPRPLAASLLVAALVGGAAAPDAGAQNWSVDLSGGQILFAPAASRLGTGNLTGTVRFETARGPWIYGSGAVPIGDQAPAWGGIGSAGRLHLASSPGGAATFGVDVGAHGFLFHDAIANAAGNGGAFEVLPLLALSSGRSRVELQGGLRGQAFSFTDSTRSRSVFEAAARVSYGSSVRVEGESRLVRSSAGIYPFLGGSLAYRTGQTQVWAHAGRWVSDTLDDAVWGAGAEYAIAPLTTIWASVREEGRDPLYWNLARRTWSVGGTRRFGRAGRAAPAAERASSGEIVVRVPFADAPGSSLAIAGTFNDWQPQPMRREGREWVIGLRLEPGVYHYAFRSASGDWFVPESTPGRREDGMGGHQATLVVR